jgi:hypothetical protein
MPSQVTLNPLHNANNYDLCLGRPNPDGIYHGHCFCNQRTCCYCNKSREECLTYDGMQAYSSYIQNRNYQDPNQSSGQGSGQSQDGQQWYNFTLNVPTRFSTTMPNGNIYWLPQDGQAQPLTTGVYAEPPLVCDDDGSDEVGD